MSLPAAQVRARPRDDVCGDDPPVRFRVLAASQPSWEEGFEPALLADEPFSSRSRGWRSRRLSAFPVRLALRLGGGPHRVTRVELLCGGRMTPSAVSLAVDDRRSWSAAMKRAVFEPLGRVEFDDPVRAAVEAAGRPPPRQLRRVRVDAEASTLVLTVHAPHPDPSNRYEQAAILAVRVRGRPLEGVPPVRPADGNGEDAEGAAPPIGRVDGILASLGLPVFSTEPFSGPVPGGEGERHGWDLDSAGEGAAPPASPRPSGAGADATTAERLRWLSATLARVARRKARCIAREFYAEAKALLDAGRALATMQTELHGLACRQEGATLRGELDAAADLKTEVERVFFRARAVVDALGPGDPLADNENEGKDADERDTRARGYAPPRGSDTDSSGSEGEDDEDGDGDDDAVSVTSRLSLGELASACQRRAPSPPRSPAAPPAPTLWTLAVSPECLERAPTEGEAGPQPARGVPAGDASRTAPAGELPALPAAWEEGGAAMFELFGRRTVCLLFSGSWCDREFAVRSAARGTREAAAKSAAGGAALEDALWSVAALALGDADPRVWTAGADLAGELLGGEGPARVAPPECAHTPACAFDGARRPCTAAAVRLAAGALARQAGHPHARVRERALGAVDALLARGLVSVAAVSAAAVGAARCGWREHLGGLQVVHRLLRREAARDERLRDRSLVSGDALVAHLCASARSPSQHVRSAALQTVRQLCDLAPPGRVEKIEAQFRAQRDNVIGMHRGGAEK